MQLDSNETVEVIRAADSPGACLWFYYAKGSGIWINLGRTIVFQEHCDAFEFFGIEQKDINFFNSDTGERRFYEAVRKNGNYDSVQFTCCREQVYKFEIVFVNDTQPDNKSPCTNLPTWGRGLRLCKCDPTQRFLNCDYCQNSSELD